MAPNLVTFIGWIFVILSYAVMLTYDYTFTKIIPSWTFLFAAACIWIYVTLDAIDGKQARRTKSSSPLGQLFDHGCDSFSMSFFVLAVCQAVRLETNDIFFIFMVCKLIDLGCSTYLVEFKLE
jgi:phosphatidylglycerophosphate synthase